MMCSQLLIITWKLPDEIEELEPVHMNFLLNVYEKSF